MAGFTDEEKATFTEILDTVKKWWQAPSGSIPERTYRDRLVDLIEVVKEESE